MPELITKHPDIVLKLLNDVGAQCSTGAPQQILKVCPAESFCSLPTGELCVYGVDQVQQMTQITPADITTTSTFSWELIVLLILLFLIGFLLGWYIQKKRKRT